MSSQHKREVGKRSFAKTQAAGIISGIIIFLALNLACSIMITSKALPYDMMKQLLMAACFTSSMLAALISSSLYGSKRIIAAISSGILTNIIIVLTGILWGRRELINKGVLTIILITLAGSIIGGLISCIKPNPKK